MIITLTTDFGSADPFVGIMKGVILGIAPNAQLVDITHDIRAYDILEPAFIIDSAYRYFPDGTVHVVVVDPGVGSARRPIAAGSKGHIFVAPDNGVLSCVLQSDPTASAPSVHWINNRSLFLNSISQTFHGRDIFAPIAAHLARGTPIESVGPGIVDFVKKALPTPRPQGDRLVGTVLRVDKFGNIVTNLRRNHLSRGFSIRLRGLSITRLCSSFSEAEPGEFFEIEGSTGYNELALHQGSEAELGDTTKKLKSARAVPQQVIDFMKTLPKKALPMEVLRTTVSMLSMSDPETEDMSPEANLRKTIRLTAQTATIVTAFDRIRNGKDPVAPRADLSHAANFAYMLNGTLPNETMTKALDIALILHADHELNASTFGGRVTAATLSDIYSAVTSAVGALKGPLHGGANEAVMRMLKEIGEPSRVDAYVHDLFAQKKKISGFGHRVYHTEDPRATHLRRMSKELCERAGQSKWYEMSARIEEIMKSEKKLNANVDFYSATTYHVIGMPIDLFTPFFAVSRMSGWTAHILEQYSNNRLIRPRAEYKGPEPTLKWVPVSQR